MTKKNTKRALIAGAVSMLLCVSMLIGSTFAWFTDEATVAGNKIQSGSLDIELYSIEPQDSYANEREWVWTKITESQEPLFSYNNWEPGYVQAVNLRIENVGTLAAKIKVNIVAVSQLSALADVIDVYMSYSPFVKTNRENWIKENQKIGTLREVIEGQMGLNIPTTAEDVIYPQEEAGVRDGLSECYACFAFKMQESAGNEYQNMELGAFDIRVLATQATYEEDSFDNQYDADAEYLDTGVTVTEGSISVPAGETLIIGGGEVLNAYKLIEDSGDGVVINDINFEGTAVVWGAGETVTINGGTFKATAIVVKDAVSAPIVINGGYFDVDSIDASTGVDVTINGGTFTCDPTGFVAEGKTVTNNGDGTWTVTQPVAA